MAMTRFTFPAALEEGVNAWFGDTYREYSPEWSKVFETKTSRKAFEYQVITSGFGPAPIKAEGAPYDEDEAREGWKAYWVHNTVALRFSLTEEAKEDNLYFELGADYAMGLARAHRETEEIQAASILNNAFDTNYPIGTGQPLISATQPLAHGGTASNRLSTNADFSEAAVEDMLIQINTANNERGLPIALKAVQLITAPQLMFEAARVLKSDQRVGTADNDINAIRQKGFLQNEPTILHRLTDQDAWFIQTDAQYGLQRFNRIKMQRRAFQDDDTGNFVFTARQRYSYGVGDWRSIFGSSGS